MKKLIVVLLVLTAVTTIDAQLVRGWGIKVGAAFSNQSWDYKNADIDVDWDSKTGFSAGLFAEFLDIPVVSVLTELNYVQKGVSNELILTSVANPAGEKTEAENTIDYIELLAAAKVRFPMVAISPYVFAGPRVNFELGKSFNEYYNTIENDLESNVAGISVGIGVEAGLVLPFSLLAEYRYDYDFSNVFENDDLEIKNSCHRIQIGIMF